MASWSCSGFYESEMQVVDSTTVKTVLNVKGCDRVFLVFTVTNRASESSFVAGEVDTLWSNFMDVVKTSLPATSATCVCLNPNAQESKNCIPREDGTPTCHYSCSTCDTYANNN